MKIFKGLQCSRLRNRLLGLGSKMPILEIKEFMVFGGLIWGVL